MRITATRCIPASPRCSTRSRRATTCCSACSPATCATAPRRSSTRGGDRTGSRFASARSAPTTSDRPELPAIARARAEALLGCTGRRDGRRRHRRHAGRHELRPRHRRAGDRRRDWTLLGGTSCAPCDAARSSPISRDTAAVVARHPRRPVDCDARGRAQERGGRRRRAGARGGGAPARRSRSRAGSRIAATTPPERALRARDHVLRVRIYRAATRRARKLDWKGPTRREQGYKLREEIGTHVGDAERARDDPRAARLQRDDRASTARSCSSSWAARWCASSATRAWTTSWKSRGRPSRSSGRSRCSACRATASPPSDSRSSCAASSRAPARAPRLSDEELRGDWTTTRRMPEPFAAAGARRSLRALGGTREPARSARTPRCSAPLLDARARRRGLHDVEAALHALRGRAHRRAASSRGSRRRRRPECASRRRRARARRARCRAARAACSPSWPSSTRSPRKRAEASD